ncbi:MAG TPA: putative sugar O-methyltransferase [Terriglobia bacterium]|nr:putative sugar O-methyltransferase [Terriglobia bacterium]
MFKPLLRFMRPVAAPIGLTGYNLYLLRSLKRPEWVYGGNGRIPYKKLTLVPAAKITGADISLCERLIRAYHRALSNPAAGEALSGLWSENIKRHYQKLTLGLDQKDPPQLATALSSMFTESFLYGIASADQFKQASSWLGSRIWSLKCLDDVVSLAECLGLVRTECPEQGVLGYAFKDGLEELVEKIESALGMSIGFPNVGAPYGISAGHSLITMEAPEHIGVAWRVNQALQYYLHRQYSDSPNIVEIGAGFGGTAHWLMKLRKMSVGSYTIVDLPLANVLQGYFLSKAFGDTKVSFYEEPLPEIAGQGAIAILPTIALDSLKEKNTDLLVNENSMPEMPEQAVVDYIMWAKNNVRGIFYSYNQEAYSPMKGVAQVLVPDVVRRVGGLKLLTRNFSWMRRGYVEEVYACGEALAR